MPKSTKIKVRGLAANGDNPFLLLPDTDARAVIMRLLGLLDLRKTRLSGALVASGRDDWLLNATLGATVVQPCVITAEPVTTRIDIRVRRHFIKDFPEAGDDSETEFGGDDTQEILESEVDLLAILTESLALALPDYPRIKGAKLDEGGIFPPTNPASGAKEGKPFASLAALRDKLKE